ncbi:SCO2400 family protein [Streptomyces luteogriseus]|uniref:SCO2400 family protein n=1 Tax=Streptomyces luteogriseus TaxID=68233 RepID=UPI0036AC29FC
MDYCSSCRRHLNGALVCPGCGAYAPDIDPAAIGGRTASAPAPAVAPVRAVASGGPVVWDHPATTATWHDGTVWDEIPARTQEGPGSGSSDGYDAPDTDADADTHTDAAEGYEARPQGRAARRRQMARWKKNQRRAVVATAVALVGGGLTVAAMNGNAKPGVQAAATPEDTTMGGAAGEVPTYAEPTSRKDDTPRAASTPTTPSHADRASRHQRSRAADPRTTPSDTRTEAAAAPRELPLTSAPRKTVTDTVDTATGTSGSSASQATEPTTPPAAGSGSDAQQPTSPSTPPPASTTPPETSPADTKPKELCLLVICLG